MNPKERKELAEWLKKFGNRRGMKKVGYGGLYDRLRKDYTSILDEALPLTLTYWDLEKCKADALKYKTKYEWRKNSNAYQAALRNKWLDECCGHMEVKLTYHTLESCKKDALKYKTRKEWEKNSGGAYVTAGRNKWIEECCKHMKPSASAKTPIQCIETGVIYESQNEAAREMGLYQSSIQSVLKGRYKSTGGYTFKYVKDEDE